MTDNYQDEVHLRDYLTVILKRKWIILTCLLVVVMMTAYVTFTKTPVYQATTKLVIEKKEPNILQMEDIIASGSGSSKYYNTQYEIIKSRSLARKVATRLDLYEHEEFNPEPKGDPVSVAKRAVASAIGTVKDAAVDFVFPQTEAGGDTVYRDQVDGGLNKAQAEVLDDFQKRLTVEPVRETHMVRVSFEATSPGLAAKISNAVAETYIDHNLETKMETIKQAVSWLKDRLNTERQQVQQAQNTFMEYRQKHNIITDISPETEKIRAQKLAELRSRITEAKTRRLKAQNRYQKAKSYLGSADSLDSIPSILSNEVVSSIKKSEMDLSITLSELSKKYGGNHPKIKALQAQLENLRQKKRSEVEKIVQSLKHEYQTALSEEKMLKQTLEEEKQEAMQLNEMAIQYGVLKRKAESAKEMYDLLVKRFKEASLTEDIKTVNARVVDRATVPEDPVRPRKKRNMMLALVLGLCLGTGLSFFGEYMDNTLKTPEDLKKILGIPYLGMVPKMKNGKDFQPALTALTEPQSLYSEAYRGVRTNLLFSAADSPLKVFHVTSSLPYEGKTVTAVNLAVTLAQAGESTLIVDCDMRKPMLHKHFGVEQKGLSNILTGSAEPSEVQYASGVDNLTLIPSGPIPPNSSELLGSKRMRWLLDSLAEDYDRIILDSPPVSAVTDSTILASLADGVILVVQAFETAQKAVQACLSQIANVQGKVLGGVLNGVDMDKEGAYYSYYSYYYYYSEEGKKRKSKG